VLQEVKRHRRERVGLLYPVPYKTENSRNALSEDTHCLGSAARQAQFTWPSCPERLSGTSGVLYTLDHGTSS
jgi:hypothetical protein